MEFSSKWCLGLAPSFTHQSDALANVQEQNLPPKVCLFVMRHNLGWFFFFKKQKTGQVFFSLNLPLSCFKNLEEGFLGGSDSKEPACNAGDPGLIPGLGKSPWKRAWQPPPVFLPGESHGQRSLVGYSAQSREESYTNEWLTHTHLFRNRAIPKIPTKNKG